MGKYRHLDLGNGDEYDSKLSGYESTTQSSVKLESGDDVIFIKEVKKQEILKEESSSSTKKSRRRTSHANQNVGNWSTSEDSVLLRFIQENGGCKWTKLSEELGGSRNARQCKRRWDALTRLILQRKKIN